MHDVIMQTIMAMPQRSNAPRRYRAKPEEVAAVAALPEEDDAWPPQPNSTSSDNKRGAAPDAQ